MYAHVDILEDRQESLRSGLLFSAVAHGLVFATIAVSGWAGAVRGRVQWGDPHSLGGGSVAINSVSQLPLPARSGLANPLATDTQSQVPARPKPEPRAAKPAPRQEPPDAIALRGRQRPPQRRAAAAQPYIPNVPRPNQLYSDSGQALTSKMYGASTASSGVGMGARSAFGYRFGAYRSLIEQRIAQKWQTAGIDARVQSAPPVIITFDIQRDGSIRNVRILQGSGNRALDDSAQRAIYDASPFPPLPAEYERNTAQTEIWFQLQR